MKSMRVMALAEVAPIEERQQERARTDAVALEASFIL
jgi:hypothetical protein